LSEREAKVDCKGKGMMTTFWCEPKTSAGLSIFSASETSHPNADVIDTGRDGATREAKIRRLIDWNVTMFTGLLEEVMACRECAVASEDDVEECQNPACDSMVCTKPVDYVQEELDLLITNKHKQSGEMNQSSHLTGMATQQLHMFIESVAQLYHNNPFHNFEHCSHVVMSTRKMLNRIVDHEKEVQHQTRCTASYTFGITSSPLNQFAIVFAALIHDLDHDGVSNARLVEEKHALAVIYDGTSIAEQNSIDVAWHLLMESRFSELCKCIYRNEVELAQFRQIVVNAVLATDLFDKNLKELRETRWKKSFADQDAPMTEDDVSIVKLKAAVVVDLIIQASDVSHTMQHFTIYKKWNMKLLSEMYTAYKNGRMVKDPTDGWYEGELWFFDNYIIPLAQKLRECRVFGVSCDEFFDYARDNRMEWEMKGREIVQEARTRFQLPVIESLEGQSLEI
jgi:3'5'-cyclic nucleotide phosphodiesterase